MKIFMQSDAVMNRAKRLVLCRVPNSARLYTMVSESRQVGAYDLPKFDAVKLAKLLKLKIYKIEPDGLYVRLGDFHEKAARVSPTHCFDDVNPPVAGLKSLTDKGNEHGDAPLKGGSIAA